MTLTLAPNRYAAACGDDLVLLDVRGGTYACLPGCSAHVELAAAGSLVLVHDDDLAAALIGAGLVVEGQPRARFAPPLAERSLEGGLGRPAGWSEALAMSRALAWMAAHYWRAPFGAVLTALAAGRRGGCGETGAIIEATMAFRSLLPWVPLQGVCLYRSCLLLNFLRARGLSAALVLGVQTFPFEAHCWLQAGELVLDDDLEHVRGLAPILALAP